MNKDYKLMACIIPLILVLLVPLYGNLESSEASQTIAQPAAVNNSQNITNDSNQPDSVVDNQNNYDSSDSPNTYKKPTNYHNNIEDNQPNNEEDNVPIDENET